MIKRLLNCFICFILVCSLEAAPVSLQRATAVANSFLTTQSSVAGPKRVPARPRLASSSDSQSKYFVFENEAGGFVIVAGDDVAYPILGYSNDANINASNIPSSVKAWLDSYALEIQTAVDSGAVQSEEVMTAWNNIESYSNAAVIVSPLILTRWNQTPYYNDLCPMDNNRNERTVTGCVATAMAQVLKYWEYPVTGNGSYSYSHTHGEQSADFANTTYDWNNMPLELSASSSDIQKTAVAQLMYHCGVSVEMDYGVASTGGSGAFTISSRSNSTHCAEYALREYWGYKPTLQGLQKDKYKDEEWKKMLKDDLKAGRPIIYSGFGDGGHCFVCDGYNEDDYFHFNWGWGGLYDGYFKLNALAPGTGGTGSGGGSYNNDQQAIFGLEPLLSLDSDDSDKSLQLASTISISSSEIAYKEGFSVSASVKNTGSANFTGELGLALYNSGLELLTVMDAKNTNIAAGGTVDCTFGTTGWSELVAGLYYAAIYSKTTDGKWKFVGEETYRNMIQFRIKTDPCAGNMVYECDFESDLLGWTFAKADGINTGFAVGSAIKYQGDKALYISPDGGTTAGYTQDNNKGYVSVAYKKIYLEKGNYDLRCWLYTNLSYLDIDTDECFIGIIPTKNEVKPLDSFESSPSYLTNVVTYFRNWYEDNNWIYPSNSGTAIESGEYYLLIALMANDHDAREIGVAIDNIEIIKLIEVKTYETLEGVQFELPSGYSEYRLYWYNLCDYKSHYDTIHTNKYLIPYTQLRSAVYDETYMNYFSLTPICENGEIGESQYTFFNVKTEPFPLDTCPIVPTNLKAINTNDGILLTWLGNSTRYDLKYGTDSHGCDIVGSVNGISDTTYLLPYNSTSSLSDGYHYFFVRGICPNDTSIWRSVSLDVKAPDASSSDLCYAKPCDLYAQNTSGGIMLTWKGNAPQYEIEYRSEDEYYRRGDIYEYNDSNYVRFIANADAYTIPYGTLNDTLYHFRVRAICGNDTSFWTDYISAYNINFGDYCIPFYDLCGPNTECTYGNYNYPYDNKKTLDYRQKDWRDSYYKWSTEGYRYGIYGNGGWNWTYYRSRHTICFEGETDPRCDNELTTVPKGEKYSMRLGNWYNGEGESVTFTHKIDSGYPLILLLKYAVVLQDPSHESIENPHFTLEILDENGVALDPICWNADFAADKNAEGWKNAVNAHEPTSEEYRNVVWKDWTTIGVNLTELSKDGDKIIKIRLTTKDCTRGQHYGYAYFTLSCTTGDMQGMSCGERPERFEVAEGFKYHWYLMDDTTKTLVCDSNVFIVQPTDTNSYHVDMISLENEDCYYTLNAYTLPRLPRPQATYKHTPHDCLNEVSFYNSSYVYKIMLDGTHQPDERIAIDSISWDFGEYGTSTEIEPKLIVPNEGDTFNVSLRVVANACVEVKEYTLEIPAIATIEDSYIYKYICEGDTLTFQNKEYTLAGEYVLDTVTNSIGCDSISYLVIDYLRGDTMELYDTICFAMLPYDFYGQECNVSGTYEHTIMTQSGCDSIHFILNLTVYEHLEAELNALAEVCSGDPSFDLSYNSLSDTSLEFVVRFSADAKAAGFVDTVGITDINGMFSINLPKDVRPDTYTAEISFDNHGCEKVTLPLSIPVLYSSSIIAQRWNDFLGIKNAQYNGGYVFTDYQWFLNDQPIIGHTATQIYNEGQLLDFEGEYRVLLTREDDGKSIMTCPFTPTYYNEEDYIEMCNFVFPGATTIAKVSSKATMYIYNCMGSFVAEHTLQAGNNWITMPMASGLYTAKVVYINGKTDVVKIIVR